MLTGDKVGTAINIAAACNILLLTTYYLLLTTYDKVGTAKNIAAACNILPAGADTLELTCETFPVLEALS